MQGRRDVILHETSMRCLTAGVVISCGRDFARASSTGDVMRFIVYFHGLLAHEKTQMHVRFGDTMS